MTAPAVEPVVLVAHGSRDARAAVAIRALARAVAAARPGLPVRESYLEHTDPAPQEVLRAVQEADHPGAVLVPLLLTAAYHGRVDIPAMLDRARSAGLRIPVRVTGVLGPDPGPVDPLLLAALRRRLTEATPRGCDAVVLAAAGTRDVSARATVEGAAEALGADLGLPCVAAYASAAPPSADLAVSGLRAAGARRVAVAAYFLAPGRLYDSAVRAARAAGAVAVAAPLGDAPELADLVLARAARPLAAGLAAV